MEGLEDGWCVPMLMADRASHGFNRSKKAMRRTAHALHMSDEAMQRIIRLTTEQQKREPAEILQAAIEGCPGGLGALLSASNWASNPISTSIERRLPRHNVRSILSTSILTYLI